MIPRNSLVKKKRREGLIARALAIPLQEAFNEQEETRGFYISRVELSDGTGLCTIFLARLAENGDINTAMHTIRMFTKSARAAVAKTLNGRYAPEVVFVFDKHLDKIRELNSVLNKISEEVKAEEACRESKSTEES